MRLKFLKNIKNIIFILALFTTSTLWGQQELTPKKQQKFDELFFEAQRLKLIDDFEGATKKYLACLKLDDQNAVVPYELAGLYFISKDYDKAFAYAEEAVGLDPENLWYRLRLIEVLIAQNNLEGVIEHRKILADMYPGRIDFKLQLAHAQMAAGKYQDCIESLNQVEILEGVTEEKSVQKKDLYILLNNQAGAQKEMENLSAAYPLNVEYLGMLAQFYLKFGPKEKVEPTYLKMIELAPTDPRAHLDLAIYYRSQNRTDESVEHLKIAMANPEMSIDSKVGVLMSFYDLKNQDQKMKDLSYELIEITKNTHPENPKIYAVLAEFQMRDGNEKAAQANLRKAIELGATQRQLLEQVLLLDLSLQDFEALAKDGEMAMELYPNQPFGYLMNGMGLLRLDENEEAVEILESGLIYVINNPPLKEQFYVNLGDAYHNLEDNFNSDRYYDKALEINPKNAGLLNNYAYYLSVRNTQLPKALKMAETCNNLVPNNAVFLDTWAWVLFKSGNYQTAAIKMEEALANSQVAGGEMLEHYGDILWKLDRKEEALTFWQRAQTAGDGSDLLDKKIKNNKYYE